MVVKIAGAAYLVYVGISLIRSPIAPAAKAPALAPAKLRTVFVQGFFTNGTLWNLFVAWSSARVGGGLRRDARFARWFNRCVGGLFVWLGFRLGFSEN
jgi:threonine/homoserine/homoserine lactone efflux protein